MKKEKIMNNNAPGKNLVNEIPSEIKGWNWGAFLSTWIWGIGNNSYLPFLVFVPFCTIFMPFVCGAKGNQWAWHNKKWESIEHFKKVQRRWSIAGLVMFSCILILFIFVATYQFESSETISLPFKEKIQSNQKTQEYFGK